MPDGLSALQEEVDQRSRRAVTPSRHPGSPIPPRITRPPETQPPVAEPRPGVGRPGTEGSEGIQAVELASALRQPPPVPAAETAKRLPVAPTSRRSPSVQIAMRVRPELADRLTTAVEQLRHAGLWKPSQVEIVELLLDSLPDSPGADIDDLRERIADFRRRMPR